MPSLRLVDTHLPFLFLRRQKNRRRQGKSPISAVPFLLFDQFSFSLIPALGADEFQPSTRSRW